MSSSSTSYSSDGFQGKVTGRVFLSSGETQDVRSLHSLEQIGQKELWDDKTGASYLERVKEKATEMAQDIIAKALDEAKEVKESAKNAGYEEGKALAKNELDSLSSNLTQQGEALLLEFNKQGKNIVEERKEDALFFIRTAVEKTLSVEMNEQRKEILENLFSETVKQLHNVHSFVLRVNEESKDIMQAFLEKAQEKDSSMASWRVEVDNNLQKWDIRVETDSSRIENSLEKRLEMLDGILSQIEILDL